MDSDERADSASDDEKSERSEGTSTTSGEGSREDHETEVRREVADAMGISDLNDPRVTSAATEALIREGAAAQAASQESSAAALAADQRQALTQEMLTKGFSRETERYLEGLDATVRERTEFIPSGEGPGQGTFKETRITEYGDGTKHQHEVRVGADGKATITDLHFDGGDLIRSTRTTLTESGPVTEVLRGEDGPSEAQLKDYYGRIGWGAGGSGGGGSPNSTGTGTNPNSGTGGSGDVGSGGTGGSGGLTGIRDELGWDDGDTGAGSGIGDLPLDGSDSSGPMQTNDLGDLDAGGDPGALDGSASDPLGPMDDPGGDAPSTGSSGGRSTGGDVTSPGGTATSLSPGPLGYIWVQNPDGSQTAYDPNTGVKVEGSGPDNIIDADTGGGQGTSGGGGGTGGGGDGSDGSGSDGSGGDGDGGGGDGSGGDGDEEDDGDGGDGDGGDAGDGGDDGDDESSMPTDEQSGGSAPDPLGLTTTGIRPRWGGPDYDPNADPVMGASAPSVMPRGGGVTDPPEDDGTAADPLGLAAGTSGGIRPNWGGPDYDPNAEPVLGTPQIAPGGGGGDPTVAMTASEVESADIGAAVMGSSVEGDAPLPAVGGADSPDVGGDGPGAIGGPPGPGADG